MFTTGDAEPADFGRLTPPIVVGAMACHNVLGWALVKDQSAAVQGEGPLLSILSLPTGTMTRILSDEEITSLLEQRKVLPADWRSKLTPIARAKVNHLQSRLQIRGNDKRFFWIFVRQNSRRLDDFSVILQFVDHDGAEYTLTRFNGSSHAHTNHWEKQNGHSNPSFRRQFHVHTATERYQRSGFPIDGYAQVTSEYSTLDAALRAFVLTNGFVVQEIDPDQKRLDF